MMTRIIFEFELDEKDRIDIEVIDFDKYLDERKRNLVNENILNFKKDLLKTKLPTDIHKKLKNYIRRFFLNISVNTLKNKLMDDMKNNSFLYFSFIKNPVKQNCCENVQKSYLHRYNILVEKPKKEIRLYNGDFIVGRKVPKLNATKSVDFEYKINGKIMYINAKYIKQNGGSQDNQCRELIKFNDEAQLILDNDKYKNKYIFICLVEGAYFTQTKIKNMKKCIRRHGDFIKIFTTREYILYLNRTE